LRFLAFSDVHGNAEAVSRLVSETEGEDFDFAVFGGDFTSAWFDGSAEGERQMQHIADQIALLEIPFFYVLGNRDYSPIDDAWVECPIGESLDIEDRKFGGYRLTSSPESLSSSDILVTHSLEISLKYRQAKSLLYLYGHDHVGRVYRNYVDLGFLYRGRKAHGAREALYGCYFTIETEGGGLRVRNHSWQLRETRCQIHGHQGTFYIPCSWSRSCPLCYDDEKYRLHF